MKRTLFERIFVPDLGRMNPKTLKMQLFLFLIMGIAGLIFFVYNGLSNYYEPEGRMILPAMEHFDHKPRLKTYHRFEYIGYSYITGTSGKLYYKPKNITEALLFYRLAKETFINYLVYALISVVIFFRLRRISDRKTFSDSVIRLFIWITIIIFSLPMINGFFQEFVLNKMLAQSTKGQFQFDLSTHGSIAATPMIFVFILLYFIKKGLDLQQEQELTV